MEILKYTYQSAEYSFKVELARNKILQGVTVNDDIRERISVSQSKTLSEAIRLVHQVKSARKPSMSCNNPRAT